MTPTSVQHTHGHALDDEKEMIKDILSIQPFNYEKNRTFKCFEDIKRSPLRYLNVPKFHKWLKKLVTDAAPAQNFH